MTSTSVRFLLIWRIYHFNISLYCDAGINTWSIFQFRSITWISLQSLNVFSYCTNSMIFLNSKSKKCVFLWNFLMVLLVRNARSRTRNSLRRDESVELILRRILQPSLYKRRVTNWRVTLVVVIVVLYILSINYYRIIFVYYVIIVPQSW